MATTSDRTIGRLSLYRRLLHNLQAEGVANTFSHQLAHLAGVTPAQVRRDLMAIGYSGTTKRGYEVPELATSIGQFLDVAHGQGVALVGVGNLGRAILSYFAGRRPNLAIEAAFDTDPYKFNRVIHGCHCYSMDELPRIIKEQDIRVAIITVPAGAAQHVADALVAAGVRGIVNFAPTRLRVPPPTYVEDIDMTVSLEKVAFFARKGAPQKEART
ncbi:MAG: redox-sensing transcriptional repressor Rex [Phycisphaerae bacterium]